MSATDYKKMNTLRYEGYNFRLHLFYFLFKKKFIILIYFFLFQTLKNDELLEEFKKILELVFSKENLKKVRKEIKRGRELIDIIKMKLDLKKEFEHIRKIVSHLQSTKACQLIDAHFEP